MYFQVSDQSSQIHCLRLLLCLSEAWNTRTFLAEEGKRCLILQLLLNSELIHVYTTLETLNIYIYPFMMHTHNFHQITLNDLKLNLFLVLSLSLSQSWTGWLRGIRKLMGKGGKDPFRALGVIWLKMHLLNPILFFQKWIYVLSFSDVSVKKEFVPWPFTAFLTPRVEKDALGIGFPWISHPAP